MTSSKDTKPAGVTRRSLLVAGATAPAMAITGTAPAEAAAQPDDHIQVRLKDTDHIRAYYARAKG